MSEQERARLENGASVPLPLFALQQETMLTRAFMEHEAKRSGGARRVSAIAFVFAGVSFMASLGPPSEGAYERFPLLLAPLGLIAAGLLYAFFSERSSAARYRAFFGRRRTSLNREEKQPASQ